MDEDVDLMTLEELIGKVKKLRRGIVIAAYTSSLGTILHFGDCCRKGQIRSPSYRIGRNQLEGA